MKNDYAGGWIGHSALCKTRDDPGPNFNWTFLTEATYLTKPIINYKILLSSFLNPSYHI